MLPRLQLEAAVHPDFPLFVRYMHWNNKENSHGAKFSCLKGLSRRLWEWNQFYTTSYLRFYPILRHFSKEEGKKTTWVLMMRIWTFLNLLCVYFIYFHSNSSASILMTGSRIDLVVCRALNVVFQPLDDPRHARLWLIPSSLAGCVCGGAHYKRERSKNRH